MGKSAMVLSAAVCFFLRSLHLFVDAADGTRDTPVKACEAFAHDLARGKNILYGGNLCGDY
jgi:hypothetical protein